MNTQIEKRYIIIVVLAIKIAIGSSVALYISSLLDMSFAVAAGIIAMLTILTTKIETLKLSLLRLVTFIGAVILAWVSFSLLQNDVLAFGLFLLLLIIPSHLLKVPATIAINAVIGTHFLTTRDFSLQFIINEFLLVFIGSSIAILLNLLTPNWNLKKRLLNNMLYTEQQLQILLDYLSTCFYDSSSSKHVWDCLKNLEGNLSEFSKQAYEYQGNTLTQHRNYYVAYFEMRQQQCNILRGLQSELENIHSITVQASIVADFIVHIKNNLAEHNNPDFQLRHLDGLLQEIKKENLPTNRQEFESRALLYHILMDSGRFLEIKRQFYSKYEYATSQK